MKLKVIFERVNTAFKSRFYLRLTTPGVLYVHFNKTQNLSLSALLLEPTGKTQYLCLDDYHFVLQRYAKSLNTHLSTLIASSDIEGAKQAIRQLLYLPLQFFEKNIRNRDLGFTNNYGFIDNKPVLLDAGKLVFSLDLKSQEKYQKKTRCFLSSFRSWIATSYPSLLSECDVVITEIVELLK